MKISAIINYGDELFSKNYIENCLKTLRFCQEIIIIDFSKKGVQKNLVDKYKLRVFKEEGKDFSFLRNLGAKKAKEEWLLYLDPDERITAKLAKEILSLDKNENSAYYFNRKNYYLGKKFKHAGAWPDKVLRLIKKESLLKWEGIVHEQPKIKGKTALLRFPLIHLSHRNIEEMTVKTLNWSLYESKLRLEANHPKMSSWRFWRILLTSFWNNFLVKKSFLEGVEGVIEGMFQVFSTFFTYVRLWEKQQDPSLAEKYKKIDQEILKKWQAEK